MYLDFIYTFCVSVSLIISQLNHRITDTQTLTAYTSAVG